MKELSTEEHRTWSTAFDRGNYDAAYESQTPRMTEEGVDREGYLLGFFSSYELDEISADWREEVEDLRAKYESE